MDNYKLESDQVKDKIKKKIETGERVFVYENGMEEFKDLNEYCIKQNLDFVDPDFIISRSL